MLGIQHSKQVIADLGKLAVDGIALVKKSSGLGEIRAVLALMGDFKALVSDARSALPELKELDAQEAAQLAEQSYEAVRAVVAALA